MKKFACLFAAFLAACLLLPACGAAADGEEGIAVTVSAGVEEVVFTQDGERLIPVNGKLAPKTDAPIFVEASAAPGYRKSPVTVTADGTAVEGAFPAGTKRLEVTAYPNAEVALALGSGEGYEVRELARREESPGFTALVGIWLESGYREATAALRLTLAGETESRAVAALAGWGLDETALHAEGYASFYELRVLEDAFADASGVTADPAARDVVLRHAGGEGYTLKMLVDSNGDGISDSSRPVPAETSFVRGTVVNLMIVRDSAYRTTNARLYANGTEVVGTQGGGADESDPLSNELVYPITLEGDTEITVEGVEPIGAFALYIMNSDGTVRYRTFSRADTLAEALGRIPGNDAQGSGYYEQWWEPEPAEGNCAFGYWVFDPDFREVDLEYRPKRYENVFCGWVPSGRVPTDPGYEPMIPVDPELPGDFGDVGLPASLRAALDRVARLRGDERLKSQWVLAWAAYQLYGAGVDLGRPAVYDTDIYDAFYDDRLGDYKTPAANDLWAYAYDMRAFGSSPVDLVTLRKCFLNGKSKRNWANNEALVLEVVGDAFPEFEPKTSFTIGDTDDLNMTFCLILDRLGKPWTLSGNKVKGFTEDSYRAYVREHAAEGATANVCLEVFGFIDSLRA